MATNSKTTGKTGKKTEVVFSGSIVRGKLTTKLDPKSPEDKRFIVDLLALSIASVSNPDTLKTANRIISVLAEGKPEKSFSAKSLAGYQFSASDGKKTVSYTGIGLFQLAVFFAHYSGMSIKWANPRGGKKSGQTTVKGLSSMIKTARKPANRKPAQTPSVAIPLPSAEDQTLEYLKATENH